jgi:hypothetical protein
MSRPQLQVHPVLSPKEEEDVAYGKNRAKVWMERKVPSKRGGSSRVKTEKSYTPKKHATAGMDFPTSNKLSNFKGVF